jgi:hypothetical protein
MRHDKFRLDPAQLAYRRCLHVCTSRASYEFLSGTGLSTRFWFHLRLVHKPACQTRGEVNPRHPLIVETGPGPPDPVVLASTIATSSFAKLDQGGCWHQRVFTKSQKCR